MPYRHKEVTPGYEKGKIPFTPATINPLQKITFVPYAQPHWARRKTILAEHPEIQSLMTTNAFTALWVPINLVLLTWLAWMVSESSLVTILVVAYTAGAVLCHAQWVLVHELTHDLVFRSHPINTFFLLLANVTHIFPSGVTFRYHHRVHHGQMNDPAVGM